jgi:hypothetical protein
MSCTNMMNKIEQSKIKKSPGEYWAFFNFK